MMNGSKKMQEDVRNRNIAKGKYLFDVSEDILAAMEDQKVSKAELARRLGKKPPQISKLLNGYANMTLGTLFDIAYVLELTLEKTFREYSYDRFRVQQVVSSSWTSMFEESLKESFRKEDGKAGHSGSANDRHWLPMSRTEPLRKVA